MALRVGRDKGKFGLTYTPVKSGGCKPHPPIHHPGKPHPPIHHPGKQNPSHGGHRWFGGHHRPGEGGPRRGWFGLPWSPRRGHDPRHPGRPLPPGGNHPIHNHPMNFAEGQMSDVSQGYQTASNGYDNADMENSSQGYGQQQSSRGGFFSQVGGLFSGLMSMMQTSQMDNPERQRQAGNQEHRS